MLANLAIVIHLVCPYLSMSCCHDRLPLLTLCLSRLAATKCGRKCAPLVACAD